MGLGVLEIRLLEKLIRAEKIRSVAALGRPVLMLPDLKTERAYLGQVVPDKDRDADGFPFWEPWLARLSILRSLSMDVSRHEGATLVHDLNQPLPAGQRRRWDLVIDPGTCEHAWNYAQAIQNAADLVRPGGWLFFGSPCEGMAGHGFFQISPEFFYRRFDRSQGFSFTQVWLNCPASSSKVFSVVDSRLVGARNPSPGKASLLLCVTRKNSKLASGGSARPLLQSDYRAVLEARQPRGTATRTKINKPGLKAFARKILSKKTYAKIVAWKARFMRVGSFGPSRAHYRPVAIWPPTDFPRLNQAESKAESTDVRS